MKLQKVDGHSGRWVVLDNQDHRLGEIFGSVGRYQAQTMRGTFIGNETSRGRAIALFAKPRDFSR